MIDLLISPLVPSRYGSEPQGLIFENAIYLYKLSFKLVSKLDLSMIRL